MLIERRTDDDVIVSGTREELDIGFGGHEDPGGMAVGRARHLHVWKHVEPDESAHPRIFRARQYQNLRDDLILDLKKPGELRRQ
jgi:hypothetical protein